MAQPGIATFLSRNLNVTLDIIRDCLQSNTYNTSLCW